MAIFTNGPFNTGVPRKKRKCIILAVKFIDNKGPFVNYVGGVGGGGGKLQVLSLTLIK